MKNLKHYAQMAILFVTGAACGYLVAGTITLAILETLK